MLTRDPDLIGSDARFLEALTSAEKAARQDIAVLICGETGSGKGQVAEFIHKASGREGQFLSINCAAFQTSLFESELFGYMKGAFTGAENDKPGLFETAESGTLFLDEIGDTPSEVQPKLLRAVEQGVIRRVGGRKEISVDVRLVCATNKDLREEVRKGRFREDLFYRINSFIVTLPSLRERRSDIETLARYFLKDLAPKNRQPANIDPKTLKVFAAHKWPGNVRELRSAVQHAYAQAGNSARILPEHLPPAILNPKKARLVPDHHKLFKELDDHGGANPFLWAKFLVALAGYTGNERFSRGDFLECLRQCRSDDTKEHALAYEWLHHIKPAGVKLGLLTEEGKKVIINRDACETCIQQGAPDATRDLPAQDRSAPRLPPSKNKNTNVPGARTSFVGRGAELASLCKTVREGEHNLVTIIGPGGMGKTRIAREVAATLAGKLPGGAWFVDLVEARDAEGVAGAVAQALGVPLHTDKSPEEFVGSILELRKPMLLVLDNFEQVVSAAPQTVATWCERAPHVRFLVTSRARLAIRGELGVKLASLPLPTSSDKLDTIAKNDAIRLFVARAQLQHASFRLTPDNASDVASVCQRLEGLPLAIELAAARIGVLKPNEILDWLDQLLPVLETEQTDVTPRHRSLQVAIDWSFNLLNAADKSAFLQLSVFRGGFYIDAAAAILKHDQTDDPSRLAALNTVQRLCDNSLVRVQDTPYGNRFSMYVAIHEYAQQQWRQTAGPETTDALRQRHASYYRDYIEQWNREGHGRLAVEALDRLDLERSNVQYAMNWADNSGREPGEAESSPERRKLFIQLAGYLTPTLIFMRGPIAKHIPVLRRALEMAEPEWRQSRISLTMTLGVAEKLTGAHAEARSFLTRAIDDAEEHGFDHMLAISCTHLADMDAATRPDVALEYKHRALAIFERNNQAQSAHACRVSIAYVLAEQGRYDEALQELVVLERLVVETGDLSSLCHLFLIRGLTHAHAGDDLKSLLALDESERLSEQLQDQRHLAQVLLVRHNVLQRLRRTDESRRSLERASEHAFESGDMRVYLTCLRQLAAHCFEFDRLDDAEDLLRRAVSLPAPPIDQPVAPLCRADLGLIRALRGDAATGEVLVREVAQDILREGYGLAGLSAIVNFMEVLCMGGKHREALEESNRVERELAQSPQHADQHPPVFFRLFAVRSQALRGLGKSAESRSAADAALAASKQAGYTNDDPSPRVRRDMATLAEIIDR